MPETDASSETVVKETATAEVQLNDDGAPSQVNGYHVITQLGEGSFSKVYKCQDGEGRDYALKILNKSFLKRKREYKKIDGKMVFSNAFQKVQKEVAIMKKLAHDNLVKLHEIIDSPADDKMFLVLELITGGQVMKWEDKTFRYRCERTTVGVMETEDVRRCMRDVVDALGYLHSNLICHRDIKPENILLAGANTYKLADFGVAHMVEDSGEKKTLRNTEGTYHFLAPECTTGEEYDPYRVDIWALGVTMYTLLFGTLPFGKKAASLTDVMDSIRVDPLQLESESLEADCEHLMRAMMTKDPLKRITIAELKEHPWLLKGAEPAVLSARAAPSVVEVTREEIEAAFTPVNNFILMARLKMRMSSRLARARNSIVSGKKDLPMQGVEGVDRRRFETFASALTPLTPALPALEASSKADDVTMPVSPVASSSPPSLQTSTSPAKATIAMLTRRLSHSEMAVAPSQPYDTVVLPSEPETSPTRPLTPHEAALTRRKSAMRDKLVVQNWQLESTTDVAIERDIVTANTILNSVSPAKTARENETDSLCLTGRTSPSRPSTMPPIGLPKLDLSSASSSPSGSPVSGRPRQKLTPRFSKEDLHIDLEKDDDEAGDASSPHGHSLVKRSPTDKRQRTAMLHQGVIHPAPLPAQDSRAFSGETTDDGFDDEEADQFQRGVAPRTSHRSPPKRKTQDETKAAITNIINRTQGDSTSPTASPAKESPMMLHRRKSSNTDSSYHSNLSAMSHGSHPLPILVETVSSKTEKPLPASPERPASLQPLTLELEKKPTATSIKPFGSKKHAPSKSRRSERSGRSERSARSSGRASTYAAEEVLIDHGADEDEGTSIKSPRNPIPSIEESPQVHGSRGGKHRELSLALCLPEPMDGGEDDAADVSAPSPHGTTKHTEGKTSPTLLGLFRKSSYNNVSPAETSRDTTASDELTSPRKSPLALESPSPSPTHGLHASSRGSMVSGTRLLTTSPAGSPLASPTAADVPCSSSPGHRLFKRRAPTEGGRSPGPMHRTTSLKGMFNIIKKGTSPTSRTATAVDSLRRQTTSPSVSLTTRAKDTTPTTTTTLKSASCIIQ